MFYFGNCMAFCLKIFRMGKPGGGGVIADRRDRPPADGGPLRPGKGAFRTVAGKFIRAGKRCVRNFFLYLIGLSRFYWLPKN